MSMMFCDKCDVPFDTDYDTDCPRCEELVEVAPDIYLTEEEHQGNVDYDNMRDNEE